MPFRNALPRMARSAGKSLLTFYISGIVFRVIREGKPFSAGTVFRILRLVDLPGWSEFLAAFFGMGLMAIALFIPMRKARKKPWLLLILGAVCLLMCFIPYDQVVHPLPRLFIGTTAYASFPVLQYLPYFLLGVYYAQKGGKGLLVYVLPVILTLAGAARSLWLGGLPSRFPPDIGWILLPALGLALLMVISRLLGGIRIRRFIRLKPQRPLCALGRSSLYYLLAGNLAIFALAGRGNPPHAGGASLDSPSPRPGALSCGPWCCWPPRRLLLHW